MMKPEFVTITLKVEGKKADGQNASVTTIQEIELAHFPSREHWRVLDTIQRFAANMYERAVREANSD